MSRRRYQIDFGALFWLIAILCVCLVVFPAMLSRLDELMPKCVVYDRHDARPRLNAASIEGETAIADQDAAPQLTR